MFTVADMIQPQNNVFSIPARELVPLLREITSPNPANEQARQRLVHWDFNLDKDSVEAGIYEMWQRQIQANIRATFVPKEVQNSSVFRRSLGSFTGWKLRDGRSGSDPIAGRDAFLLKSLDEAVAELTKHLGADMVNWKLGAHHHALIRHPMTDALKTEERTKLDVGNLPCGGDTYTVDATGGTDNQPAGGSFKIIVDTEDWDNSVDLNNPGQSGDANDPHYRDLYHL